MVDVTGNVRRVLLQANSFFCRVSGRSHIRFSYRDILLELPLDLMTLRIAHGFENNYCESSEARQITAGVVRKGDTVLEIGAAIGFLTAAIGKTGMADRIVAAEANPVLAELAKRTCRINGVKAEIRTGLVRGQPSENEEDTFFLADEFWASSPLASTGGRSLRVPVLSLARLLAEIRPTLLVIDIKGGEVELLAAARLDGVTRVMLEMHEHIVGLDGVRAVFASLAREGFAYNQHLSCANVVTFDRCVRQ